MLKEYFIHSLILCAFIALASGISHPRLRWATGFGVGVLLICVIVLPLVDILTGFDKNFNIDKYLEGIESEATRDVIEEAFEEGIREHLATEYRVDKSFITVMADGFDIGSMRAQRIYVTLTDRAAMLDYKSIEALIESEFTNGGECEVSVRIG